MKTIKIIAVVAAGTLIGLTIGILFLRYVIVTILQN